MLSRTTKERVISVAGRCLRVWPLTHLARGFFRRHAAIIFYHGVWRNGDERNDLFACLPLERLLGELRTLARHFRFVPLERMLEPDTSEDSDGKPMLALTFDDGFDLTAGGATEVLDSLGIRATMFVNTNSVDYERLMWQHRPPLIREMKGEDSLVRAVNELHRRHGLGGPIRSFDEQILAARTWPADCKEDFMDEIWAVCEMPPMQQILDQHRPYFDWDGLRVWMDRGHGVGLHTCSHPFCSRIKPESIEEEIVRPVEQLRQQLGLDAIPFAYPFGDRLVPEQEQALIDRGLFTCLLGTGGFSLCSSSPYTLDRVDAEPGTHSEVFGRPVIRELREKWR